jgi:hypothetical protein
MLYYFFLNYKIYFQIKYVIYKSYNNIYNILKFYENYLNYLNFIIINLYTFLFHNFYQILL